MATESLIHEDYINPNKEYDETAIQLILNYRTQLPQLSGDKNDLAIKSDGLFFITDEFIDDLQKWMNCIEE